MTDTSTTSPDTAIPDSTSTDTAAAALGARNRLVITLLLVSTFVVILNETIMSVALPHLMRDLNITADAAQWLTSAFMLTMAVVIPITGFLLQRLNTRTVFITAMTLFSAGTLFAAVSPGFELLVVARVVQASGTAIMIPLLFTTVLNLVPMQSRGRVMGNISIVISVAPAIGPMIGGLVLSLLDWRWMFILVLPIALVTLIIGARRVPNVSEPTKSSIDVFSVILSAFGFGGLVFGLSNVGTAGIAALQSWLPLAVGVVGVTIFILRQVRLQKTDSALLDLRTFRAPTFRIAFTLIGTSFMAMFGSIILLPLYTQTVLSLEPLASGLLVLPGGLVMGLLAPFVGRAYDRIGPRPLVVPGTIIVSASLWGMTLLGTGTSYWWVLVAHVIMSVGLSLMFTPLFTAGLGDIPRHLYSHGSAAVSTIQQLAGAAGIALFITVMSATIINQTDAGIGEIAATATGIQTAFIYGAVISLAGIPLAFFLRKPAPNDDIIAVGH